MINKRDFLKGGATAIVASAGTTATLAAVRPSLGERASASCWQAHVGQGFDVDGHAVTLRAVSLLRSRQPGEQLSLSFVGELPAALGDGVLRLTPAGGDPLALYLARTPEGLRADFSRVEG